MKYFFLKSKVCQIWYQNEADNVYDSKLQFVLEQLFGGTCN